MKFLLDKQQVNREWIIAARIFGWKYIKSTTVGRYLTKCGIKKCWAYFPDLNQTDDDYIFETCTALKQKINVPKLLKKYVVKTW